MCTSVKCEDKIICDAKQYWLDFNKKLKNWMEESKLSHFNKSELKLN